MTFERLRAIARKTAPFALGAALLGVAGGAAARHFTGSSCCQPGAACCHPGSPCCHGHGTAGSVAAR